MGEEASVSMHSGLTWPVGISSVSLRQQTVPLHSLNTGRQIYVVGTLQRDCEIVYALTETLLPSSYRPHGRQPRLMDGR